MAIKIKSVQESIEDTGLKCLVFSKAGLGKTVLCATAGASTLIISAEAGLLSLGQNKEKLIKKGSPDFDISHCQVAEVGSMDDLEEVYDMVSTEVICEWLALDSISEIAERVLKYEMEQSSDPRKIYPAMEQKMIGMIKKFRDLKNYNVIMTSKQAAATDSTTGVTSYVPMMPGNKLSPQIPYLFDEVFVLRIGQDDELNKFHYLQCTPDQQYSTKDRSGALTDFEPPSLKAISKKIKAGMNKKTRKPAKTPDSTPSAEEIKKAMEAEE